MSHDSSAKLACIKWNILNMHVQSKNGLVGIDQYTSRSTVQYLGYGPIGHRLYPIGYASAKPPYTSRCTTRYLAYGPIGHRPYLIGYVSAKPPYSTACHRAAT